jgi:hypothetical protein
LHTRDTESKPTQLYDEESYAIYTSCNLGTPQPTNFLVGVKDCSFTQNATLCGSEFTDYRIKWGKSYTWTGLVLLQLGKQLQLT